MSISGRLIDRAGEARVLLSNAEYVEDARGQRVQNDHSWLMKIGGEEVWLRKADVQSEEKQGDVSISASHARDMHIDIGGDTEEKKPDPLVQASLGMNSASPSATKDNQNLPRSAGQSKQQT